MYWRNNWWEAIQYPSCKPIELAEGMLVSHKLMIPVRHIQAAIYHQVCYEDAVPMLNTNLGLVLDKFSLPLPIVQASWREFTRDNVRGSFAYSVVSIVYSISILAVIIWFLTIFVLTNYTIKASLLLKASTSLSSVYILVVVVKAIVVLHNQQRDGYLHGAMLLDYVNNNLAINVIDMIVVLLLQINQVQVIMRIFSRQQDKRTAFFVGLFATSTSQVIWAVTKFHKFLENDEAGDILPAFIYLVRIVMGVCYAAIITVYLITKLNYIIANKKIWLLTLLTVILIYSPVAFFIADVCNAFVYELSEIFSVVTYVVCVVIPWEWCNKFNLIMKANEKEGILGRRFHEDELYELDRFELFVEEDGNDDEDGSIQLTDTSPQSSQRRMRETGDNLEEEELTRARTILLALKKTKRTFLSLTDGIIAAGFAIPRSVSISTPSFDAHRPRNSHLEEMGARINDNKSTLPSRITSHNNEGTLASAQEASVISSNAANTGAHGRNGRNVFVYSRKEVVINFSDEEIVSDG